MKTIYLIYTECFPLTKSKLPEKLPRLGVEIDKLCITLLKGQPSGSLVLGTKQKIKYAHFINIHIR